MPKQGDEGTGSRRVLPQGQHQPRDLFQMLHCRGENTIAEGEEAAYGRFCALWWPEPRAHAVAGLFALQLATRIRGYFVQEDRGIQIGASELGQAFDAKCRVDAKLRYGFQTEGRKWSGGNSAGVSQAVLVG